MRIQKMRNTLAVLAALATLSLMSGGQALAASVTVPATASVNADSQNGSSVALPALTVTETAAGDIPVGTLTWALPAGFVFDTSSVANVAYSGTGLMGDSTVSFPDSNHVRVNITATSTAVGTLTIGSTTPLKVKASAGTPLASGNIALSSGTITGLTATSSFGTLTETSGAANKLAFSVQPPATVTTNAAFNAAVAVQDQFGNTVTGDNGRAVTLSVVAVNPTTTTGSLNNAVMTSVNGIATFSNLSFTADGTINLQANASGLTSTSSNNITFSTTSTGGTGTTTPPSLTCGLQNGMLVKLGDSPTVYMVVNCVLRPFNSAAIFHARGKKFEDVRDIEGEDDHYAFGLPVGQGNDNNSTIITPPASSSTPTSLSPSTTPPSLSNLPDGSVVKVPGDPTVYLVSGGVLQPFTSLNIFRAHKKSFGDIQTITQQQLSSLTVGSPATFPDGTLLKGPNHTVYVVKGGQLYGIPSMSVFDNHGWKLQNIMQVQQQDLNSVEVGGVED
ncbi:MAG: hypothetical protein KGJ93_03215 [Patescibacteria group bacterium]|nr:hypothetical protein [Patescibacteria group bacterium]